MYIYIILFVKFVIDKIKQNIIHNIGEISMSIKSHNCS